MLPISGAECNGITILDNLDDLLYVSKEYNKPFKIINLDYKQNISKLVNATIKYSIKSKEETVFVKGINKYKTAGTGRIKINASGNITICAEIINSSSCDNLLDNKICSNHTFIDTRALQCSVNAHISTDKNTYHSEEKISIILSINETEYPFIITYWMEDVYGRIVKKPVSTSNTNVKHYTVKEFFGINAYSLFTEITEIQCNNSENAFASKQILLIGKQENSTSYLLKDIEAKDKSSHTVITGKVNLYATKDCALKFKILDGTATINSILHQNISQNFQIAINNEKIKTRRNWLTVSGCVKGSHSISLQVPLQEKVIDEIVQVEVLDAPDKIISNHSFSTRLKITSSEKKVFKISYYLYRGSKCYSDLCSEDITEVETNSAVVQLSNIASKAKPGEYKLATIVKESKKIWFEEHKEIILLNPDRIISDRIISDKIIPNKIIPDIVPEYICSNKTTEKIIKPNETMAGITGQVIYKSDSLNKNQMIFAVIFLLAIIDIAFILYK